MKKLLFFLALVLIVFVNNKHAIAVQYSTNFYPVNFDYKFGIRSPFITAANWEFYYPRAKETLIYGTPASWYVDDEFDGGIRQDQSDF